MKKYRILMAALVAFTAIAAQAQCPFHNDAFKSGEFLTYNLYYNWQFVWVKAGNASMSTVQSRYNGHPAYRASLTTRGNDRVDQMFVLRDTLLCYSSLDMEPLYFRKGAREGKRYGVDEVFYSYHDGKVKLRQHQLTSSGEHLWANRTVSHCVYDMLNIFLRARSFNPEGWKSGHEIDFPIADGKNISPARLRYSGKVKIKADNGVKYRCLKLSYLEKEDGKYKRIVDFYVSDDKNHIPVRLDMFLKFGAAKAFLVSMKGLRNPVTSVVR